MGRYINAAISNLNVVIFTYQTVAVPKTITSFKLTAIDHNLGLCSGLHCAFVTPIDKPIIRRAVFFAEIVFISTTLSIAGISFLLLSFKGILNCLKYIFPQNLIMTGNTSDDIKLLIHMNGLKIKRFCCF